MSVVPEVGFSSADSVDEDADVEDEIEAPLEEV